MHRHKSSCSLVDLSEFFLQQFKNGHAYLTMGTTQVLIPLIRFLLQSFVSRSFLVILLYSFLNSFFISACLIVSASNIPELPFLQALWLLLDLAILFLPLSVFFHFSLWTVHFLSMKLSGIIAITNCYGESESVWKMHIWIFTSVKVFLFAKNYNFHVVMAAVGYLCYIFRQSAYLQRDKSLPKSFLDMTLNLMVRL